MEELLKGFQVVSLAVNLPGPIAASRLCELGARVIKVEPPSGDPFEQYCPDWYQTLNEGQERRVIDLKSESGLQELETLLSQSDLLLTAQRSSALSRLGLGWEALHLRHPALNHLAIVGYPPPNENHPGHDLTYQASLALLSPPHMPKSLIADLAGAERAAFAGLSLLMSAKRGDAGRQCFVALSEAAEFMGLPLKHGLTSDKGLLGGAVPEYGIYQAKEGWLAIAALEPHFRIRLQEVLEIGTLTKTALAKKLKVRDADEWVNWAKRYDLPIVKVV